MHYIKRDNIFLYAISIAICAASYIILNKNIELSLLPHKTALEYLFNFNFVFIENVGYAQTNGLFIIAQNCLGSKLFINLFLIMIFGFLHKYTAFKHKIAALLKFYCSALVLAFVITVIRISASVPFCSWDRFHLIHNTISLMIYFASGLVLYLMMERKVMKRC
jgi:exosortase K